MISYTGTFAILCPDARSSVVHITDLLPSYPKQPWARFITSDNRSNASNDALDLLDKLLRYDHQDRLTAAEAQAHAYFSKPYQSLLPSAYVQLSWSAVDVVRLQTPSNPTECLSDSGFYST